MSYPQESFVDTSISPSSILAQRRDAVSSNTLFYQLEVLKKTGRYDAFKLEWHPSYSDPPDVWPVPNHLFWDSDVAKWIEGACYFLHGQSHSQLHSAINALVQMIRSAQQPDGYLNIHYTVVEPGKRFTNLRDMHELYNAGHLIEAALAHNHLYRNDDLLEPILKYVDLLHATFGPGEHQIHGYPGHPEIELALLRLYHRTQNQKHLELASYFVSERGNPKGCKGQHYYAMEAEQRGENPDTKPVYWGGDRDALWYYQAHKPLVDQEMIKGHSVRAVYLLTAAADLVRTQHSPYTANVKDAIYRLWNNMIQRKMYVTGGIGAMKQWEGFGQDYFLPQGTDEGGCYAETCAAIGTMMLAERILQYDLDRKYSDVMELCLYNAVLTAMSCDGTKFTYVNQLASSDQDLSTREEWFTCACCPPNVLRLFGSLGGYIYSRSNASDSSSTQINVHLYISSQYTFEDTEGRSATLTQKSDWPWDGRIEFELKTSSTTVGVALRIPAWTSSWKLSPSPPTTTLQKGYLILPPSYLTQNPSFTLEIEMKPRLISPHPFTNQNTLTLARGPIVYCAEDIDNPWVQDHFRTVQLDPACRIVEKRVTDHKIKDSYIALTVVDGGASSFDAENLEASPGVDDRVLREGMNCRAKILDELHFVPYYFRANRGGRGQCRVGLRRWIK